MKEKYFLESTSDKTDRTTEIEAMLRENGACILGGGVFYVSGVTMPEGTMLSGIGPATEVILLPEITSGAAVELGSYCSVKDMTFIGSAGELAIPESVGDRHGIAYSGSATVKDWRDTIKYQPKNSVIHGVNIRGFSGGGLTCRQTGYGVSNSLDVSDCNIEFCGVGLNIPYFSEFHKFTNNRFTQNFIGCVNNGGNNVFANCGFDSNVTGFIIDNADGKAVNNSHGSAVGCTFNHSGNNEGIGIIITNAKSGFVFSGCQLFYSKIIVKDSPWINFNAFNFGKNTEIEVSGVKTVMFVGSYFHGEPKVSVSDGGKVNFHACFTSDGEPIGDME